MLLQESLREPRRLQMRIRSLTLTNWGPYRGSHTIDFTCTSDAPVVLVHGENEHGKTSIFRAIRWALYGFVHTAAGREIPAASFANLDQVVSGLEFEFGATLVIENRIGQQIEIKRLHTCLGIGQEPQVGQQHLAMRELGPSGQPVEQMAIESVIRSILHPEISDFVLFDGEMLERFEERLKSSETASRSLKRQIEMALGIPSLTLLRNDLEFLIDETGKAIARESRKESQHKSLNEELDGIASEIERNQSDLERVQNELAKVQEQEQKFSKQLERTKASRDIHLKRQLAEEALDRLIDDEKNLRRGLQAQYERYWWLLLQPKLTALYDEARLAQANARLADKKLIELTYEKGRLEAQLAIHICQQCGQEITDEVKNVLREQLEVVELEIGSLGRQDFEAVIRRATALEPFAAAKVIAESVRELEKDIQRKALDIAGQRSDIAGLTAQLESAEDINILALESNYRESYRLMKDLEQAVDDIGTEIQRLVSDKQQVVRKIAEISPAAAAFKAELAVLNSLRDSVDSAIASFGTRMRERVQEEATKIFKAISRQDGYDRLRIDPSYYLRIVDKDDRVIEQRSAGADQIVSTALMGALAVCAVDDGPLFIDTPLARLDLVHRERMLKWFASQSRQVVLFLQSGEFERERHLSLLEGRVGREYQLRKLSLTSSVIEEVAYV